MKEKFLIPIWKESEGESHLVALVKVFDSGEFKIIPKGDAAEISEYRKLLEDQRREDSLPINKLTPKEMDHVLSAAASLTALYPDSLSYGYSGLKVFEI